MTDNNTQTAAKTAKTPKAKTIADDMEARRIFDSRESFNAYFATLSTYEGFDLPIAAPGVTGVNEDGTLALDPEVYSDGVDIAVELMTKKGEGAGSSIPRCIIVRPNPSLDLILADDKARDWLAKIAAKEMSLVATRPLRKVDDVTEAVESMPKSLADYITGREASSTALEAYNEHWDTIKKTLAKASKAFALAPLSKKTLRQAMESAAFAKLNFPLLEDRGSDPSWFVIACQLGAGLAKKAGQDASIFAKWIETRDSFEIDVEDGEEEAFSVEAALAALDQPETAEQTGEGEQTEQPETAAGDQPE